MHGSQYAVKGTPDILGCRPDGQAFALEAKAPGGEAPYYDHIETLKQHLELMAWKRAGALVGVIRSVEDAEYVVFDQPTPPRDENIALRGLLTKATAVIADMRYVDRYNANVDFDVEELLKDMAKATAPAQPPESP